VKNLFISLIIISFISIIFYNCHNDPYSYPGKGKGHALKNGMLWNTAAIADTILRPHGDTISIKLFTYDEMGYTVDFISFENITMRIGKYYFLVHDKIYKQLNVNNLCK